MKIAGVSLKSFFAITVLCLLFASFLVIAVQGNQEENNQPTTAAWSFQSGLNEAADLIVRGAVEGVDSQLKGGSIWSRAAVLVHSVEKGVPVSKVVVEYEGGEVGDVGLSLSDQPRFSAGEQVLLYLTRGEGDVFTVVGGPVGKVLLDSSGQALQEQAGLGYSYSGFHWPWSSIPVEYYVNTEGGPTDTLSAVQAGFQAWSDAGATFSFQYRGTTTQQYAHDGYNVVCWQYIDGPGHILAVSTTWYYPLSKEIFECDIRFDTSESWAADASSNKFDVQDIAAHESGHWLQLNDLYYYQYSEMTMYGYASPGETKKRTLEWGDIAGIRFIYSPQRPTIDIYTDMSSYKLGETARISGHIVNPGPAIDLKVKAWAQLPDGSVMNIMDKLTTIPANGDITRTYKYMFPPDAQKGVYTLHAQLIDPSTQQIISEDTATFTFS